MKLKFLATILAAIVNLAVASSDAMAFTPSFSMIKQACSQMRHGIKSQLVGIEGKLNISDDQQKLWNAFVGKFDEATKPVHILCFEKFGPNAANPGWFAPAAEREKAERDKQEFMATMEQMGAELERAMVTLKAGLRSDQVSIIEREFVKR